MAVAGRGSGLEHEDHDMMRPYEVIDPEEDNFASQLVDAAAAAAR